MLKIVWAAAFLMVATSAQAQGQATPDQAFGFDYTTANFSTYSVLRFEMQVDAGPWTSVEIPPTANDAQTPTGANTYRVAIPAMTPGSHTVNFRACNNTACGDPSTPMAFVLVVQPPAPTGARILSVGQ